MGNKSSNEPKSIKSEVEILREELNRYFKIIFGFSRDDFISYRCHRIHSDFRKTENVVLNLPMYCVHSDEARWFLFEKIFVLSP